MKIPLSNPDITEKERKAVLDVLKTPNLALGPKLKEFEEKFAQYIGAKYAIAVNSGTSALHLLIKSIGIKEGDGVITTPFSFIASANCILYEKAKPIFVDIDPLTLNIDPGKIEKTITNLPAEKRKKLKAMVIVDVFGFPADWDKISKIAKKYNLKIIEDSCEAIGAEYKSGAVPVRKQSPWRKCGSFGDAATFAFYPNKQITTGEGGLIVTNNKKIADHCRALMNQGRKVENGKWLEHFYLGYNYRMSDINAALGLTQLSRLQEILKKREKVAKMYDQELKNIPEIQIPYRNPQAKISWFVYVVQIKKNRDQILKKLRAKGIACSNYFQPIHLQPLYRKKFQYKKGDFPITEKISQQTIALPFYNNLTQKQIKYIVKNLKECL
ncbi:DegT/DnrJ/EryC1/StrS family aminotransferase [Patescibacteria group bacterium]|nr:DegT/DnrJ/EryC1/StrS family aminotransferase [Patescibacteria group bacterium]